jgi:hypothetical protein
MLNYLRKFRDDQNGSMSIELLLVTPILVWALLSTYVYFDLFRVESNSNRAALTIADMLSRETGDIDASYLNTTRNILRELTYEEANPDYRITVYTYRESNDSYRRIWSKNRGMAPNYNNTNLNELQAAGRLPALADDDRAILLQTRTEYDAPFSIGLGPFTSTDLDDVTFQTFIVIRPRPGKLCFLRGDNTKRC